MTKPPQKSSPSRPGFAVLAAGLLLGLGAVGCTGVPAYQQRYLVRPEMQFSDDPAYALAAGILYQTETGAAVSGGAASAGCTSCR